jgi:glycosyltransferase involved in cell wall biosynthesis
MRHLLICSRSHEPQGGADRIVVDLCRELPARGWKVTLGLTQGRRFNDVTRFRELMGSDLPISKIDGREGTRAARVAAIRALVRSSRPDVVLSMRVFDAYEAVAREKEASRHGPRLAVGIRSFEAPYFADLRLYRDCVDLCVASGKLVAALATDYCGMDRGRVVSIGGGVHAPGVPVAPRTPRQPLRLLHAGRLDAAQKRILDLPPFLDSLDELGVPFELDLAGAGAAEADLREALAARVELGQVRCHGWLSAAALCELYARADCFIHFAAWEGMTIAPREAMAHGVVPVISAFDGIRLEGQFRDGVTALIFPVGDVRAAAQCVRRLATEVGLLEHLSAQGMSSQGGEYSFTGSMDAWARALERCLAQPPAMGTPPSIGERNQGRLSRWCVPAALHPLLRSLAGRRVEHASPGSEWPTSSGSLSARQASEIAREAARVEASGG